jgi:hypothetical protein
MCALLPKLQLSKGLVLLLMILAGVKVAHATRMYCLCCDDDTIIEMVVKQCRAVRIEPELLTFTSKPSYDLVITGVIIASINHTSAMELRFEELETNLHIEHDFVYSNQPTDSCEAFQPGQKKLMHHSTVGCILVDGEVDFGDDTLCTHGGYAISPLSRELQEQIARYSQ